MARHRLGRTANGVKLLVDHFGIRNLAAGTNQAGFQTVLRLARDGLAAVKLSAPFRVSGVAGYRDLDPIVEVLLREAGPGNLMWGSDWPFIEVPHRPTFVDTMAPLDRWLGFGDDRDQVLWRTPPACSDSRVDDMSEAKPLRVAIAGAGMISWHHLLAWQKLGERVRLVAVCDPDTARARKRADEFGIPHTYSDAETLLSSQEVDAWTSPRRARRMPHGSRPRRRAALPRCARSP
jgi:hypothetical protein